MTVAEIFERMGHSPCGPVRWKEPVPQSETGAYVIARVGDPDLGYPQCEVAHHERWRRLPITAPSKEQMTEAA
jgi:hypothetical protein